MRDVARVTAAALVLGAIIAGAVAVTASASMRAWYGLTPEHPLAIPAWELWTHNARTLLPLFGATLAAGWYPWTRWIMDVLVGGLLVLNVGLVAVAFGAYGGPLLRVAPAHYAFELMALAVGAAAYLDARRERSVRPRVMGGCALVVAGLLGLAAVTEGTI